jgi:hypothetical protein
VNRLAVINEKNPSMKGGDTPVVLRLAIAWRRMSGLMKSGANS